MKLNHAEVVSCSFGDPLSERNAFILAPVMPAWDQGAFFRGPVESLLATGHHVTIYDTLSLLEHGDDFGALVTRWAQHFRTQSVVPDVLMGNALGGAVVQALLCQSFCQNARVVIVSGPTVADEELDLKLERIASTAAGGPTRLSAAMRLLAEVVQGPSAPNHVSPAPRIDDPTEGARRLSAGLRLLKGVDTSNSVLSFAGPLLHLFGEQSLLVGRQHLGIGPHRQHKFAPIPRAGMRPHAGQAGLTKSTISAFLQGKYQEN